MYESKTSELKNQLRVATEAGIGGTATVSSFFHYLYCETGVQTW